MYHVIGLGNTGSKYEQTRHNVGRDIVAAYALAKGATAWTKDKLANALHAQNADTDLWLPETFMNQSGTTARYLIDKRGAAPEQLIVVYDEIDLPLGKFKIVIDRGHGGHNGIRSIESALKSRAFTRVRIGVAATSFWTGRVKRPGGGEEMSKYVLGRFSAKEMSVLEKLETDIFAAIDTIIKEGTEAAMNRFN